MMLQADDRRMTLRLEYGGETDGSAGFEERGEGEGGVMRGSLFPKLSAPSTVEPRNSRSARVIAGDDRSVWLEALIDWSVPLVDVRLFVLPTSEGDLRPSGVLVLSESEHVHSGQSTFNTQLRSLPYRRLSERLYVPTNAVVTPPVTAAEWSTLLPAEIVCAVWHPVVGLVGFEAEDVLRVSDLLLTPNLDEPCLDEADWSRAQPGDVINRRLWTIAATDVPTAQDVIDSGGGDIGTQATDLEGLSPNVGQSLQNIGAGVGKLLLAPLTMLKQALSAIGGQGSGGQGSLSPTDNRPSQPPTPGVVQSVRDLAHRAGSAAMRVGGVALFPFAVLGIGVNGLLQGLGRMVGGGMLSGGNGMLGGGPGSGGSPEWLRNLSDRFFKMTAEMLSAQQREMNRLMKLLETNPDEGLKFGLPIGGEGAARGLAPPSSWLSRRLVDFSLGALGGGGPADVWDMPPDMQFRLVSKYRELAEREIRLKRYRRAAYIYAKLLGDLSAAANVLLQGKHYREAAILYRDKLNRPHDAALAFEKAGLFEEAIALYETLDAFETIGDLYLRLERPEQAEAAFEQAVARFLSKDDRLAAVNVIRKKLHDDERALVVLEDGWPQSGQAKTCLERAFVLTAELGRHEHAVERIESLRSDVSRDGERRALVEVLVQLEQTYPDAGVKHIAADTARVVTSQALRSNRRHNTLLKPLSRLAPEDRLLSRDCRRYGQATRGRRPPSDGSRVRPALPATHPHTRPPPRLLREIAMPEGVTWQCARSTQTGYYVAGYRGRELVLVRGVWEDIEGRAQTVVTWTAHGLEAGPLLMGIREGCETSVVLFPFDGPALPPRLLPANEYFRTPTTVETPGWLPDDAFALDTTRSKLTWFLAERDCTLTAIGPGGSIMANKASLSISLAHIGQVTETFPMHARTDSVFFAIGHCLIAADKAGNVTDNVALDDDIVGLAGSPMGTLLRLCVLFEEGGIVYRSSIGTEAQTHTLSRELRRPVATYLRDGSLVVCAQQMWQVFDHGDADLRLCSESTHEMHTPVDILLAKGVNDVAVVSTSGPLRLYDV